MNFRAPLLPRPDHPHRDGVKESVVVLTLYRRRGRGADEEQGEGALTDARDGDADVAVTLPEDAPQDFVHNAYDPFSENGDHDWLLYEEEDALFNGEPDAFFSEPGLIF